MADSMELCCGADPCCHGNDIFARRGDLVAYRLVTFSACIISDPSLFVRSLRSGQRLHLLVGDRQMGSGWVRLGL